MIAGGVSISLALLFGALTPSWPGFVAVCLLLGIGMSCIQTPAGVLVTRSCKEPDAPAFFLPRIFPCRTCGGFSPICWQGGAVRQLACRCRIC